MIGLPSLGRHKSQPVNLGARLDALEAAVNLARDRLDPADVEFAQHVVDKARIRLRHGTSHTLVALLGATGSGKSSLANAIVGTDVATTGVRRPTTSSTLALVWGDHDATGLLDWLEVKNRHLVGPADSRHAADLDGLVLLDVPDHDSVAVSHRLEMERVAEHADLLVWVTDPEKYGDDAMHHYLRLLGRHGAVTLMVLNKIDRLERDERAACERDLSRLLVADGIDTPAVLAVSATEGTGIDAVRTRLSSAVSEQRAVIERLSADVAVAGDALAARVGTSRSVTLRPDTEKRLATDLAEASGVEVVAEAAQASYRRGAAARTGWPVTRWIRRLRPDPLRRLHLDQSSRGRSSLPSPSGAQTARALAAIRQAAETAAADLSEPWPTRFRDAATPEPAVLHDRLDLAVADAVRADRHRPPRWWSAIGALQFALTLVALAGALWLTALAANNWLRLPEFSTPDIRGIPLPTGLLIGALVGGWLLALLARRLAAIGGRRRSHRIRVAAADAVGGVVDELVLTPLRAEITARDRLITHLEQAGAVLGDRPR